MGAFLICSGKEEGGCGLLHVLWFRIMKCITNEMLTLETDQDCTVTLRGWSFMLPVAFLAMVDFVLYGLCT